MDGLFQSGDRTNLTSPPPIASSRSNPATTSFHPARVVLEEQRAAVMTLSEEHSRRSADPWDDQSFPIDLRVRLVDLAIRVLTQAVLRTELECRHIVAVGEARAADIVREAHFDVDRLPGGLAAGAVHRAGRQAPRVIAAPKPFQVHIPTDVVATPEGQQRTEPAQPECEPWEGHESGSGDDFFSPIDDAGEDPWSFMDDDAPALIRRALKRPVTRRQIGLPSS